MVILVFEQEVSSIGLRSAKSCERAVNVSSIGLRSAKRCERAVSVKGSKRR
jgi:hypothetical protein